MLKSQARRRHAERGQALVMALALIAFVGVVSVAVFRYADSTQIQHRETASTAAAHAPSEGAGLYALVDSSRPDAPMCAAGNSGSLSYSSGETLTYTVASNGCTVGGHSSTGSPGENCALCILNPSNATPFSTDRPITITGEVDMNGTAGFNPPTGSLCSKKVATDATCTGTIVDHGGNLNDPGFSPKPTDPGKVVDPFGGIYPLPPTGTAAGSISGGIAHPGLYSGISNAALCPGVYVITGTSGLGRGLSMAAASSCAGFPGDGVTMFLTCGSSSSWQPCTPGQLGGSLSYAGNDASTLNGPSKGVYANLVLFGDPNNASIFDFHGNGGLNLTGSVYAPSMTYSTNGNGATIQGGRMVIAVVALQHSVNGSGLSISGSIPSSTTCGVASETLSVAGTGTASQGHVVIQTACNGGNAIVSFDYQP